MKKHQNSNRTEPRKKKHLGQHFLHKQSTVDNMIAEVAISADTTVLEIGCGDGFLTRSILQQTECKQLRIIEIDPEWVTVIKNKFSDPRIHITNTDVLDYDFSELEANRPLVLLANLPYQITFPLFERFARYAELFQEAVVMIQEEPAQKIVASRGKSYGWLSLYLQYYFDVKLMEKVEPGAFNPPPKVFSRLLYFKPKQERVALPEPEKFWKFIRMCFKTPRQTLRNNLKRTHFDIESLPEEYAGLRAQQLDLGQFIELWSQLAIKSS